MRWSALILLILTLAVYGQDRPPRKKGGGNGGTAEKGGSERYKKLKDQEAPELVSTELDWINAKKPLTLKDLKGLVIVLEFSNHT